MIPVAQLKKDMDFYKSLGALIEVLKLIAAAQYQSLEKKIKTYAVYLKALEEMFAWVDVQKAKHPFVSRTDKPAVIVAVTTDAGLLGGLNAQVVTRAMKICEEEDGKLIIIGKRGQLYVEKRKMIFANFSGILDDQRLVQALKLRDYLVRNVLEGKMGTVKIVYPHALSFTSQRIEAVQLLPFNFPLKNMSNSLEFKDVILESSVDTIVEYLIYLWLGQKIFEIFGISRLGEQAARFMHLENCTQRIKDLDKSLRFQYFRMKHEIVDRNMRELFAARLLNNG